MVNFFNSATTLLAAFCIVAGAVRDAAALTATNSGTLLINDPPGASTAGALTLREHVSAAPLAIDDAPWSVSADIWFEQASVVALPPQAAAQTYVHGAPAQLSEISQLAFGYESMAFGEQIVPVPEAATWTAGSLTTAFLLAAFLRSASARHLQGSCARLHPGE